MAKAGAIKSILEGEMTESRQRKDRKTEASVRQALPLRRTVGVPTALGFLERAGAPELIERVLNGKHAQRRR